MNRLDTLARTQPVTDVYTNLHGLQQLGAGSDRDEALKKVAQQFESMFLNILMKNMRSANAVFEKDNPFDSQESRFYRDMHDQQLSLTLSHQSSIGLADAFYRQLSSQYGQGDKPQVDINQHLLQQRFKHTNPYGLQDSQTPVAEESSVMDRVDSTSLADSPESFIALVELHAEKAAQEIGVPAELLIAQAALETGWGKYVLADDQGKSSYNLFNIKADSRWQGDSISKKVLEYQDGIAYQEQSLFRRYDNLQQSFDDYVQFLGGNQRYEKALTENDSPQKFMQALQDAGYATDPDYAKKVLAVFNHIVPAG